MCCWRNNLWMCISSSWKGEGEKQGENGTNSSVRLLSSHLSMFVFLRNWVIKYLLGRHRLNLSLTRLSASGRSTSKGKQFPQKLILIDKKRIFLVLLPNQPEKNISTHIPSLSSAWKGNKKLTAKGVSPSTSLRTTDELDTVLSHVTCLRLQFFFPQAFLKGS